MKTIKIIDLLNKIAKGEEVPKKIATEESIFEYVPIASDYKEVDTTIMYWLFRDYVFGGNGNNLNDEVKIIEEEKELKKICLDDFCDITYRMDWELLKNDFNKNTNTFVKKINELIDVVNELKGKSD